MRDGDAGQERCRGRTRDPRNDFAGDTRGCERDGLFSAASEHKGIAAFQPDDPANASVYLGGVVRRGGVTLGISTDGAAPALAGLLREALDAMLPADLEAWSVRAHEVRQSWRARGVPMEARRPELLEALNELYEWRRSPSNRTSPAAEAGRIQHLEPVR